MKERCRRESALSYKVRPFERAPLRCQEYGHVGAVCRGVRSGRYGKDNYCVEECKEDEKQVKCLHCEGNHHAGSAKCLKKELRKYEKVSE